MIRLLAGIIVGLMGLLGIAVGIQGVYLGNPYAPFIAVVSALVVMFGGALAGRDVPPMVRRL